MVVLWVARLAKCLIKEIKKRPMVASFYLIFIFEYWVIKSFSMRFNCDFVCETGVVNMSCSGRMSVSRISFIL